MRGLFVVLFAAACGGGASSSPLVGTWYKGPSDSSLTLVVGGDRRTTLSSHGVDSSSSCVTDAAYNGTWSSTDTTVTMTYSDGTVQVSGCSDPSMNLDKSAVGAQQAGINNLTNVPWAISGDTLTLTISNALVSFTRQ